MIGSSLSLCIVLFVSALSDAYAKEPFTVFGYLPEYRLNNFNYDAAFQTGLTHLIFFSIEIDSNGLPSALDRLPSQTQAREARAAANKVGGKLMVSFGGNSRSQNYALMTSSAARRRSFLEALNGILTSYQLDGVDYNWEYPANDAEWRSWKFLLKESKTTLLKAQGKVPVVTFTIYVDPAHYVYITRKAIIDEADYVLAMAYDQPGEHATIEFFQRSIDLARQYGVPLEKFVPGLPFYARHVQHGEAKTMQELRDMMGLKGGGWKPTGNYVGPYFFNPPSVIEEKTRLAKTQGVGGVMIWELGQDLQPLSQETSLMRGVHRGLGAQEKGENGNEL